MVTKFLFSTHDLFELSPKMNSDLEITLQSITNITDDSLLDGITISMILHSLTRGALRNYIHKISINWLSDEFRIKVDNSTYKFRSKAFEIFLNYACNYNVEPLYESIQNALTFVLFARKLKGTPHYLFGAANIDLRILGIITGIQFDLVLTKVSKENIRYAIVEYKSTLRFRDIRDLIFKCVLTTSAYINTKLFSRITSAPINPESKIWVICWKVEREAIEKIRNTPIVVRLISSLEYAKAILTDIITEILDFILE